MTRATMLSWHFYVVRSKLQLSFEEAYREQQGYLEKGGCCRRELESLEATLEAERKSWVQECEWHKEVFDLEESELAKSRTAYTNALQERKLLEKQHTDTAALVKQLVSDLTLTEKEILSASTELQAAEDASLTAKAEVKSREEACEEVIASGNLKLKELQTEAAKQQERRQRDVRELRQKLSLQLRRHEDAVARLEQGQKDDQSMWTQKLRQSEARSAKLENDVQATKKHLQSLPIKAANLEAENAVLLASVEQAEAKLRVAEDVENKRKSELAKLRSTHSELQTKNQELGRESEELSNKLRSVATVPEPVLRSAVHSTSATATPPPRHRT
jgi:chromosome segregation ATPase